MAETKGNFAKSKSREEMLEFLAELGERFPDMPDAEVIRAADEFDGRDGTFGNGWTNPESFYGLMYIEAYKGGIAQARGFAKAYGLTI